MNITKENICELVYNSINQSLRHGERSFDYSHSKISTIVDELFFVLAQQMKNQNSVEIRGFGRFSIEESKVKKGRNFKTGESILIPSKKRIRFKPSPALYEPITQKFICENEVNCPSRISTIIKKDQLPIRICRYYYRCPSRTPDLFQNDPKFSKYARVLNVTTGELVRAKKINSEKVQMLGKPLVIIYCETKPECQKIKFPHYFIVTFEKDLICPNFNSGPSEVSFNNQLKKCYVRNSYLDYEFNIHQPVFKSDEVLKILLNARF